MRPEHNEGIIFAIAIAATAVISYCSAGRVVSRPTPPKSPYEQALEKVRRDEQKASEARLAADRAKEKALIEAAASEGSTNAERAALEAEAAESAADAAAEHAKDDQLKANVLKRPTR